MSFKNRGVMHRGGREHGSPPLDSTFSQKYPSHISQSIEPQSQEHRKQFSDNQSFFKKIFAYIVQSYLKFHIKTAKQAPEVKSTDPFQDAAKNAQELYKNRKSKVKFAKRNNAQPQA